MRQISFKNEATQRLCKKIPLDKTNIQQHSTEGTQKITGYSKVLHEIILIPEINTQLTIIQIPQLQIK